jgi:site-specific recombinase XerC
MAREGKAKVLTEAEFKRLLIVTKNSPMSTRNVAMIFCSFGLGLRSKEICSLSIKDIADSSFKLLDEINLKRNMTKGEKQRAVYLSNKKILYFNFFACYFLISKTLLLHINFSRTANESLKSLALFPSFKELLMLLSLM